MWRFLGTHTLHQTGREFGLDPSWVRRSLLRHLPAELQPQLRARLEELRRDRAHAGANARWRRREDPAARLRRHVDNFVRAVRAKDWHVARQDRQRVIDTMQALYQPEEPD